MHAMAGLWRSDDTLQELVLSFHPVGSRDHTKVFRFGDKHLKLLSHLYRP